MEQLPFYGLGGSLPISGRLTLGWWNSFHQFPFKQITDSWLIPPSSIIYRAPTQLVEGFCHQQWDVHESIMLSKSPLAGIALHSWGSQCRSHVSTQLLKVKKLKASRKGAISRATITATIHVNSQSPASMVLTLPRKTTVKYTHSRPWRTDSCPTCPSEDMPNEPLKVLKCLVAHLDM